MIGRVALLAVASMVALSGCQLLTRTVTLPVDTGLVTCITFQMTYPGGAPMRDGDSEAAAVVIEGRLDGLGASGATVQAGPDGAIVVGPPSGDQVRWLRAIEQLGESSFVAVPEEFSEAVVEGQPLPETMDPTPIFDGSGVASAAVSSDEMGRPSISLTLTPDAAVLFDAYAAAHYGEWFAIVLDGIVVSAPSINATRFDGQAQISGSYTLQEAEDLAIALGSGRLPAPVARTESSDPIDGACRPIEAEG